MRFMGAAYRNLVREMASSQFAVRDQNSILGLMWSFLNPVLMVAVMFAYFGASAGKDVQHYAVYLLLGMIHYTHFANTTNTALGSLAAMAQLTRHTILPKETIVIGSIFAASVEFAVSMVFCIVLAWCSGIPATITLVALPLIMMLQMVFATWVSLLLAAARVFVKDLSHIYQVCLRLLFFATPIFYAAAFLRSRLAQTLLRLNPLAQLIGFSRALVIDGTVFPMPLYLLLLALNCLALWASFLWFKRMEPRFAEYV